MIHKVSDGYVISEREVWRPGVYDTKDAATYASRFADEELQSLQDSKHGGVISLADLEGLTQ